jgi:hypothetical protein
MSYQTHYVSGDANGICDVCGFQYKLSQLRKRWDGMMVCRADFEERHPQDYMVRARADKQSVQNARPDPEPVFISPSKGEDL